MREVIKKIEGFFSKIGTNEEYQYYRFSLDDWNKLKEELKVKSSL